MINHAIETFDLTKIYKLKGDHNEILALNKINLKIKEGEIFGLLGPNGAGKTTLVQILATLLSPTSGYATVKGFNILKNPLEIKKRIGLMLGGEMIYRRMTGFNNLRFFCKIYNIHNYRDRIYEVAKEFKLYNWLNQYVEKYSLGMKLKLALCRALIVDPPVLFLDEPTLGLDVNTTLYVIERLKNLEKTIFLTSHNMHVVENLCHRIAFINHGNIIKIGTQDEVKNLKQYGINIFIGIDNNREKLNKELIAQNFIKKVDIEDNGLIITLKDKKYYSDLFLILSNYPSIEKLQELEQSLEDLFTTLT